MMYHLFQNSIWKVVKIAKTSDITLVGDAYFLPPLYMRVPNHKRENRGLSGHRHSKSRLKNRGLIFKTSKSNVVKYWALQNCM